MTIATDGNSIFKNSYKFVVKECPSGLSEILDKI